MCALVQKRKFFSKQIVNFSERIFHECLFLKMKLREKGEDTFTNKFKRRHASLNVCLFFVNWSKTSVEF